MRQKNKGMKKTGVLGFVILCLLSGCAQQSTESTEATTVAAVEAEALETVELKRAVGAFQAPTITVKTGQMELTDQYEEQAKILVELVEESSNKFMEQYDIDEYAINCQGEMYINVLKYLAYVHMNKKSEAPVIIDEGMGISIYNQDFDENNMNVTVDGKFKFWKSENAILILKDDIEERVLNAYRINDLNNLLFLGDDFVGIEFKNLNQEEMIEIKNSKCLL